MDLHLACCAACCASCCSWAHGKAAWRMRRGWVTVGGRPTPPPPLRGPSAGLAARPADRRPQVFLTRRHRTPPRRAVLRLLLLLLLLVHPSSCPSSATLAVSAAAVVVLRRSAAVSRPWPPACTLAASAAPCAVNNRRRRRRRRNVAEALPPLRGAIQSQQAVHTRPSTACCLVATQLPARSVGPPEVFLHICRVHEMPPATLPTFLNDRRCRRVRTLDISAAGRHLSQFSRRVPGC